MIDNGIEVESLVLKIVYFFGFFILGFVIGYLFGPRKIVHPAGPENVTFPGSCGITITAKQNIRRVVMSKCAYLINGRYFCSERISVFTEYPDNRFHEDLRADPSDLKVKFDVSWINEKTSMKTTYRYYHDDEYEEGLNLTYVASPGPTSYFVWMFSKIFHAIEKLF